MIQLFLIPLLTFYGLSLHTASDTPLRAMLYCYIPFTPPHKIEEYKELARLVQAHLDEHHINVKVSVCGTDPAIPDKQYLYDPTKVHKLFDFYDIIQIDDTFITFFQHSQLFSFHKKSVDALTNSFGIQWKPLMINQDYAIGIPGLMCSDFIISRTKQFDAQHGLLNSDFTNMYSMGTLYIGYFLNTYPGTTMRDIDYKKPDPKIIDRIKNFLLQCQVDKTRFDYQNNNCMHAIDFYANKTFKSTVGYSEHMTKFIQNFPQQTFDTQHIFGNQKTKLVYLDSFIAKKISHPEHEKTIISFYKAMLSNQVLEIYLKGKYLKKPMNTYLLPPTKSAYQSVANDPQNKKYHEQLFNHGQGNLYPIYERQFIQHAEGLTNLIITALANQSTEL